MGGAFIGIADDATAADWNPAGLTDLDRAEISMVVTFVHRIENNIFNVSPESNGPQTVSHFCSNYFSIASPFLMGETKMVFSLNYQKRYDFNKKWNFILQHTNQKHHVDYQSEGSLSALGFAYSVKILENLSLGITFNIWDNDISPNKWQQKSFKQGSGMDGENFFIDEILKTDTYIFKGYSWNSGLMWKDINNSGYSLGLVVKVPFKGQLNRYTHTVSKTYYPELPPYYDSINTPQSYECDESLYMPMSIGLGISYKYSDKFTVSFDIYRTNWNDFILKDLNGNERSPITGESIETSTINASNQFRVGMEYIMLESAKYALPFCFGLFYDPAPAENSPDNFWGITIGTGFIEKQLFTFDIAYQFRFGKNIGDSILDHLGFSQSIYEHILYSSVILYF
ncbi:MAG: hypothetical protein OMM_05207 [Candidatus Magnetoglobus multicellularis str. Araruama]|uniref:Membrane protein involved in aromatic hydrocarbon degradation n=1 Tax=Candidatus Magnetoglobus multicellularis str. Araruama TaxID=890399 RepID=A0A1V1NXL3_9BACT|nr:MAG: hypothetical protein OMM_05207 [Candidatus Magnetoglobus multicellularis str. Araruama]